MANLSSAELAEKLNLSRTTISLWENAHKNSGITKKGASYVIELINKLGVKCDISWLWFGIGTEPYKLGNPITNQNNTSGSCNLSDPRAKEIAIFQSLTEDTVVIEIKKSSMSPFYNPGDIVGGHWEKAPAINESYVNCIIEFNKKIQVRRVKKTGDKYSLSFFSVCDSETEPFSIEDVHLNKIAVIKRLWIL
jgi:transcriptional regulator with XRE-family HTH domain